MEYPPRTCSITAHDDFGFWTVIADGIAGAWIAISRTLEIAVGMASYGALIGEAPRADWSVDVADEYAPYVCGSFNPHTGHRSYSLRVQDATALYNRHENAARAHVQGTLMRQADPCPDAFLQDGDYGKLDDGEPVYPKGLDPNYYVMSDTDGYYYVLRVGQTYTFADGNNYTNTDGS